MGVAFSAGAFFAAAASLALAFRRRRGLRLAIVGFIVLSAIVAPPASRAVAASGTTVVTLGASGPASSVSTGKRGTPAAPAATADVTRARTTAAIAVNPVTGNQGFAVFVTGNVALNATASAGPVALGGNLSFGPASFNVATQTQGSFTASGDSKPTGLLVGGNINWSGSSSTGSVNVQSSYMKIGDMTGSVVAQSGSAPTHVVPTGHSYSSSPQLASTLNQPTASVTQSGLINFTSAFSAFATQSAGLAACTSTIALDAANGSPLTLPLSSGTNAYLTLTAGTQNVLNVSAADLANIGLLTFRNSPSATMPLVINVDTSGVGNTFTWTLPNINGLSASSAAPYILWNFSNATQLTISGSQTVPGTVYAPGTAVNDYDGNGLAGGIIAASLAVGGSGGSPNGGQILSYPFAASLSACSAQQLTISLTADTATAVPGGTVHYTVTATNSGTTAYTGATFTDLLSDVLDDATYNSDASATAGSVTFTSPNLTWTGNLAAGAVATITFSVTVKNPDTGNKTLASTITSATAGSNCASGSTDSRCSSSVAVQLLTIAATASTGSTTPGSTVGYTVTVTNSGQASYTGATFIDSLSRVLDDAAYNGDAAATAGSVSYVSPNLTWSGSLAAGATATITFSVTVNNPDTGDKALVTAITSPTAGSNCPSSAPASACGTSVTVLVPALTIVNSASVGSATPGSTVRFSVTITNTGQTAYTGISVTDSLSGVLDDAAYNGDATATVGTVSFASPNLTWTGNLAAGAATTVTFTFTVNASDTGDKTLGTTVTTAAAGSNCAAGSTDARCATSVPVLIPGLTLTVTANTASTTPGSTVGYTVVADNTGQTADTGVSFTAALSGVLDDAAYNGNAAATAGTVSFTSPNLTWTGTLAAGATATITFSVTVSNPDTGDHRLAVTLTSAATGSNCPAGSTAPSCALTVPVAQLAITRTANVPSTTPGSVVRFTAMFTNAGQVAYTGITININAADVFDDAVSDGDQTASSGTADHHRHRAHLDRQHPGRRDGHHHRHRDRKQPRHRQPRAGQHHHHRRRGQQLPGRRTRRGLQRERPGPDPRAEHHQHPLHHHPGPRHRHRLHPDHHQLRPDRLHRDHRGRVLRPDGRRRDLRRRRGHHRRHAVLRQPGAHLDRRPGRRGHRDGHVLGHGGQPRHRRQTRHHHRDLGRARIGLPHWHHCRSLPLHRAGAHPRAGHRRHRRRLHRRARRHRALHDHDHQHRPDPVHRHHRHRPPDRPAR